MEHLLDSYRQWDGTLTSVGGYVLSLLLHLWNIYGIPGVLILLAVLISYLMKSETTRHVTSLIVASGVRAIGGSVGFIGKIAQAITLYILGPLAQAAVRSYFAKFKGTLDNTADGLSKKKE